MGRPSSSFEDLLRGEGGQEEGASPPSSLALQGEDMRQRTLEAMQATQAWDNLDPAMQAWDNLDPAMQRKVEAVVKMLLEREERRAVHDDAKD